MQTGTKPAASATGGLVSSIHVSSSSVTATMKATSASTSTSAESSSVSSSTTAIVGGIAAAIILFLIVVFVIWFRKRTSKKSAKATRHSWLPTKYKNATNATPISLANLDIHSSSAFIVSNDGSFLLFSFWWLMKKLMLVSLLFTSKQDDALTKLPSQFQKAVLLLQNQQQINNTLSPIAFGYSPSSLATSSFTSATPLVNSIPVPEISMDQVIYYQQQQQQQYQLLQQRQYYYYDAYERVQMYPHTQTQQQPSTTPQQWGYRTIFEVHQQPTPLPIATESKQQEHQQNVQLRKHSQSKLATSLANSWNRTSIFVDLNRDGSSDSSGGGAMLLSPPLTLPNTQ
ncbi:hypothetical protein HK100_003209 [Physocladia obscura]|uniref:Uncharacterized protein n=1 Tax=Physocladia obscura TaxID=109957 RepID=A0AAD5X9K1_9FUNG|nr:hypothetical protein HK100_003209 [Physocladia obscura]